MKLNSMKLKVLAFVTLLILPAAAMAQGVGETLEGLLNPQLVVAASYAQEKPLTGSRVSVLLTANILGPKIGTFPCYVGGVGVDLRTLDPALAKIGHAGWSIPYLTCAPFGDQVVLQGGMSRPFNTDPGVSNTSYYVGVGVGWNSPNTLKVKRIKRIEAKQKAKKAQAELAGPPPAGFSLN